MSAALPYPVGLQDLSLDDPFDEPSGLHEVSAALVLPEDEPETASQNHAGHAQDHENDAACAQDGETVLGHRLVDEIRSSETTTTWRGVDPSGHELAVHVLASTATEAERQSFTQNAKALLTLTQNQAVPRLLAVGQRAADGNSFTAPLLTVGDMSDTPALIWTLDRRLDFFRAVCGTFAALHQNGVYVGNWCPRDVLLDDDLQPVLARVVAPPIDLTAGAAGAGPRRIYLAPEVLRGMPADARSDLFTLGQLLHFLLLDDHPTASDGSMPRLDDLDQVPLGLVRIVRKCTVDSLISRYSSVQELLVDLDRRDQERSVGLGAPDSDRRRVGRANPPRRMQPTPRMPFGIPVDRQSQEALPRRMQPTPARRMQPTPRMPLESKPERAIPSAPGSRPRLRVGTEDNRCCGLHPSLLVLAGFWLGSAMFAAYFMGSTAWLVEMFALTAPLSGLLIGAGLPTSAERPKAGRVAFVAAACLFIHLTDPVTQIAELGDQQGFARGDAVKRARLVRNWVADGRRELCGLDLRGLDLAEIDLAQADLESSDLSAVNLTDADLGGTNLTGVQLEGANLNGAVLIGALVDDAYGFAEAHCDDETAMPVDWRCNAGHPTPDGADETEDIDG